MRGSCPGARLVPGLVLSFGARMALGSHEAGVPERGGGLGVPSAAFSLLGAAGNLPSLRSRKGPHRDCRGGVSSAASRLPVVAINFLSLRPENGLAKVAGRVPRQQGQIYQA